MSHLKKDIFSLPGIKFFFRFSFVKSVLLKRLFVLCNRCRIFSIFGCLSFLLLLVTAYQLISLIISDSMHYANFITVNTLKVLFL